MYVSIDGLTKNYRRHPGALSDVTVDLPSGMVGLIGANGAGKTTLMRLLCGIIQPSNGRVMVDGHNLAQRGARQALKKTLGYLPQDVEPYPNLNPVEFLDYVGLLKGITSTAARRAQARHLVERVGLADAASRRIGSLSHGMRRRVGIAQALMGQPQLLVVDEPTAGLDPEERMRFRALLADLSDVATMILSTHILDDVAQTCPYVVALRQGRKTFDGATESLINEAQGMVYLTAPAAAPPAGNHRVVNVMPAPEGTRYRVITNTPPPGAQALDPTLEDGYMALAMKEDNT